MDLGAFGAVSDKLSVVEVDLSCPCSGSKLSVVVVDSIFPYFPIPCPLFPYSLFPYSLFPYFPIPYSLFPYSPISLYPIPYSRFRASTFINYPIY